MPSMVSVILRAAARAASSAAWAASRCAAAAAASDSLMRASSVAAAATARSPASSGSVRLPIAARDPRSRLSHGTIAPLPPRFVKPDWAIFEADEKDLESDEALWALYERWCKFFNQERDRDEMARRFTSFKETVLCVEENKKSDLPYRLGINQFADGKLAELYGKTTIHHIKRIPYSVSPIYARAPDFLFKEEDPKGPAQLMPRIPMCMDESP